MQPKRSACPDGVFLTDGTPFTTGGRAVAGLITLEAGRSSLGDLCDTDVEAKVRAKRRFDTIKARWDACEAFPDKLTLKARIDAADCQSMTGQLRPRKFSPRKQAFSAIRLSPAALALIETLGSDAVRARMRDENFPFLIHPAAEAYNPELLDLVALGPDAVPALIAQFRQAADLADETRLSLLAVALERLGDASAVPALADWLEQNLFTASLTWAPHLVTHALKTLDGQEGLDGSRFEYDIDEMLDALARARLGAAARSAPAARALRPRASAGPVNSCSKRLIVTGINGDGAVEEVALPWTTFDLDIQELIAAEQDLAKLARLQGLLGSLRSRDEDHYGGTDYLPVEPDGDVSIKSNCGGSVTQQMLNEVARLNGFPIRLGEGTASANDARKLARTFGSTVGIAAIEPLLSVISHDQTGDTSVHVEIPTSRIDAQNLVVFSKDIQGIRRQHVVDTMDLFNWEPIRGIYNFRPFGNYLDVTTSFTTIDRGRVLGIRVDSTGCPCAFGGGIDVSLATPSGDEVDERTITVSGTVGDGSVETGTLRLNGRTQTVDVDGGAFSVEVDLRSGGNDLRLAFEGSDGARGCVERTIRAPCEFTDPADPFNGGGWVEVSVDGAAVLEWPGYSAISILSKPRAIVWFGAPPTSQPHILFELYGPRARKPRSWEVLPRPSSDNAFGRDFAVGTFRSNVSTLEMSYRHELVSGTLDVSDVDTGKERRLIGSFDVRAVSDDDATHRRVVGRFDLCRFGVERPGRLDLAD